MPHDNEADAVDARPQRRLMSQRVSGREEGVEGVEGEIEATQCNAGVRGARYRGRGVRGCSVVRRGNDFTGRLESFDAPPMCELRSVPTLMHVLDRLSINCLLTGLNRRL